MLLLLYQNLTFLAICAIIARLGGIRHPIDSPWKGAPMVNIVHVNIHCNDGRKITAIEIKLKYFPKEEECVLSGQTLVATVSAAFFKTTLLTDVGKSLKITPGKRDEIVNLSVRIGDENNLTFEDVARFSTALQQALDETRLF